MAATVVALPALCYFTIHWAVLDHWLHLWALVLLASAPLAWVAALPNGMWWLPGSPAVAKGTQRFLLLVSALGVLAGAGAAGPADCERCAASHSHHAPLLHSRPGPAG
jgi:hypothetical protein